MASNGGKMIRSVFVNEFREGLVISIILNTIHNIYSCLKNVGSYYEIIIIYMCLTYK